MTQSDKDFITRIQVSQLVSQDPYADDFYAQVYSAIVRSRMGLGAEDERVLKFGSSGGVGLGAPIKGGNRRPSAMQRMQQQVERIVSNARKREEEKGLHAVHSLQGALGKTSGRSYKASPRQLLQVDPNSAPTSSPTLSNAQPHPHISKSDSGPPDAAAQAAKLGREALGNAADVSIITIREPRNWFDTFDQVTDLVHRDPLTHREVLVTLETLYDLVMSVEQMKHDEPHPEEEGEEVEKWNQHFHELVEQIWAKFQVMAPLETRCANLFRLEGLGLTIFIYKQSAPLHLSLERGQG
jgi:DNA topoisomerase 2-associated protein PAT1